MPKGPTYTGPLTLSAPMDEEPVRNSAVDLTPYLEAVRASNEKRLADHPKPGVGFTVPTASVKRQESLFREAAAKLSLGVSFATFDHTHGKASDYGLTPGQSRIIVTARDRKVGTGRKAKTTTEGNGTDKAKTAGKPMAGAKR